MFINKHLIPLKSPIFNKFDRMYTTKELMKKITTTHSTHCPNLINVLKTFVNNNYHDVIKCNPARISRTKQSSENFDLRVNKQIGENGSFKCVARNGTIVQDVFILINIHSPTTNIKNINDLTDKIDLSLPKRAIRTKERKIRERVDKAILREEDKKKFKYAEQFESIIEII